MLIINYSIILSQCVTYITVKHGAAVCLNVIFVSPAKLSCPGETIQFIELVGDTEFRKDPIRFALGQVRGNCICTCENSEKKEEKHYHKLVKILATN